jgi:hypothetical protein
MFVLGDDAASAMTLTDTLVVLALVVFGVGALAAELLLAQRGNRRARLYGWLMSSVIVGTGAGYWAARTGHPLGQAALEGLLIGVTASTVFRARTWARERTGAWIARKRIERRSTKDS